ncbi:hypothetical protein SAMN03159341_1158 [Paenibacillus sp. 1_12]|nr:hypothetical protein SAMN03159341_1158 [Paenibacillus sp. 1_12]
MLATFMSLFLLPIMLLNLPLMKIGFDDEVPSHQRITVGYAFLVQAGLIGILAVLLSL